MARSPLRRKLEVGSGERVRACVVTLLFVNLRLVDSKIIAQFFFNKQGEASSMWVLCLSMAFTHRISIQSLNHPASEIPSHSVHPY